MTRSPVAGRYEAAVDRESAYEKLNARTAATAAPAPATPTTAAGDTSWWDRGNAAPAKPAAPARSRGGRRSDTVVEAALKSATRRAASSLGREGGSEEPP